MTHAIVIAQEALAQLDSLYDHISAAASRDTALRFNTHILDRIAALGDFPMMGAPRDDILPGLRTISFRRRVTIAFVVEADWVLVVGVFYGGQDFEALLRDDRTGGVE